jgi:hypothetical protein
MSWCESRLESHTAYYKFSRSAAYNVVVYSGLKQQDFLGMHVTQSFGIGGGLCIIAVWLMMNYASYGGAYVHICGVPTCQRVEQQLLPDDEPSLRPLPPAATTRPFPALTHTT